ncbi:hypothetical protein BLL52_0097 [Rhodoferax antarcticus ANT.BR]|uniref:Uncharacterized protein n=1 Tax=Rhodoferax antarcticus ANT.BR TaxID=1111071 RepID=A0A1Q8YKR1_9BURK|nr:hypothetical protein BLL52_0097 [Rhodoferax antarcticus ANT.BR]
MVGYQPWRAACFATRIPPALTNLRTRLQHISTRCFLL